MGTSNGKTVKDKKLYKTIERHEEDEKLRLEQERTYFIIGKEEFSDGSDTTSTEFGGEQGPDANRDATPEANHLEATQEVTLEVAPGVPQVMSQIIQEDAFNELNDFFDQAYFEKGYFQEGDGFEDEDDDDDDEGELNDVIISEKYFTLQESEA